MKNKREIKQLDSAIEKISNDFIGEDGKVRNEVRYAFAGTKNTPYQGLKLKYYRNSKAKIFVFKNFFARNFFSQNFCKNIIFIITHFLLFFSSISDRFFLFSNSINTSSNLMLAASSVTNK